jgi:hypothetical protein
MVEFTRRRRPYTGHHIEAEPFPIVSASIALAEERLGAADFHCVKPSGWPDKGTE